MDRLTQHDITLFFLALGILLAVSRLLGDVAVRFNQPALLGELLAGVILGPTVMGSIFPDLSDFFFPTHGGRAFATDGIITLSITMFLLVAGLEVDLSSIWKQGKTALVVSIMGSAVPFAIGLFAAISSPKLMGDSSPGDNLIYALFFAIALSISALPVIARTLLDLNLYRTDLGMLVIAAATFNDLIGWIGFSIILSMIHTGQIESMGILRTILPVLIFVTVILTAGRWLIHKSLPWIQAHTRWPGGVLAFCFALAFFGASLTDWMGVHAIFGAFLIGVAIGDSPHLRKHTRSMIEQFISSIFAPIFFASIGLRVNFAANFDLKLCALVFIIACVGKVIGCGVAGLISGMPRREAWALGFCMNARGVMEIILGLLALQNGLITEKVFVALTIMAILTSVMAGPIVQRILKRKKVIRFTDFMKGKAYINPLKARNKREAINQLCELIGPVSNLTVESLQDAVWYREEAMSTGLGNAVAVPHARVRGLTGSIVALGVSNAGIDFDAPDGVPANLIFLVLTPRHDKGAQIAILADIARLFSSVELREKAERVPNYTEFLALIRVDPAAH